MKVAVIGSRSLTISDFSPYLPKDTTEIVSGGAHGVDACVRQYALDRQIKLTEFLPEYERHGRGAPHKRNQQILDYADMVIAFWDGVSTGTGHMIRQCIRGNKALTVYMKGKEEKIILALTP